MADSSDDLEARILTKAFSDDKFKTQYQADPDSALTKQLLESRCEALQDGSAFELERQGYETSNEFIIAGIRGLLYTIGTAAHVSNYFLYSWMPVRTPAAGLILMAVEFFFVVGMFVYLRLNPPYRAWRKYVVAALDAVFFCGFFKLVANENPATALISTTFSLSVSLLLIVASTLRYSARGTVFAGACSLVTHLGLFVPMLPPEDIMAALLLGTIVICATSTLAAYSVHRTVESLQRGHGLHAQLIGLLRKKLDEAQEAAKRLGQYQLEEKIGEGGMGEVFRGTHAMLRRPTAIKLLRSDKANEKAIARFEREVQQTCRLTHPNTIAIYDYGRTPEGTFYYAMEFLPGIGLDDLVDRYGVMCDARVIYILEQVCESLTEAHAAGLVHRDIKPGNIIVCERGGHFDVVKVLDFGLVKDVAQTDGLATLTGSEDIAGTPQYMAPEAIETPGDVDSRTDLYAVGAVGYYLLTGRHVFEGSNAMQIVMGHLSKQPKPPSEVLGRRVDADLERAIMWCLEKDRARRPQDTLALAAALRKSPQRSQWTRSDAAAWWAQNAREIVLRNSSSAPTESHGRVATVTVDWLQRG